MKGGHSRSKATERALRGSTGDSQNPLAHLCHEEAPHDLFRLPEVPNSDFSLGKESTSFFKSLLP